MPKLLFILMLTCPFAATQVHAENPNSNYRTGNEWQGHSLGNPNYSQIAPSSNMGPATSMPNYPMQNLPVQQTGPYVAPTQYMETPSYSEPMYAEPMYAEPMFAEQSVDFRHPSIRLETDTLFPLLDFQNRQGDKQLDLLKSAAEQPEFPTLLIGAQFRLSALLARTNATNKFPYQGRFPTDFVGDSASDLRMLQANQAAVAHITPWATGYAETLFSDVFSFPTANQGSFQMRQVYVVLGDTKVTPFYAFLGKKNVSFGDMGTLSPFTQAMVWHYFGALGEGAGVGFASGGFHATFTGLSGSRGIRVVDSEAKGKVNNFAANMLYTFDMGPDAIFSLGAGYLNGTIYNNAVAEHTNSNLFGPNNGAWDVNGLVRFGAVTTALEYVQTVNAWPATGHIVQAWKIESALDADSIGLPVRFSASWSEGIQGEKGTSFEYNRQLVVGGRYKLSEHVNLSMEYVRSLGFAPLINIQTVSDSTVIQDSLVFGLNLAI